MKYELIGKNDYLNPIDMILHNRGIEDIQSFLHTNIKNVIHWSKLENMNRAIDCLLKHIEKKSKIFIQIDSDCDGVNSSAMLINYVRKIFPDVDIQWRIHEGKQHGIIVDTVPNDIDLVIIPDAGSNQYQEHKQLKEREIDVIVLDHHECERESEDAIVVNNQLSPSYTNKNFSGAGIVMKFLEALDSKLNINHAHYYMDLTSIGNIGDVMDGRELETRYYMLKGLENINNSFLKALFDKQEYSTKGVRSLITTAFYIVPLINAAIRVANMQEKLQMVKSFLESKELVYYKRNNEHETIQVNTARMLGNIKNKQGRMRDKSVVEIESKIKEKNLLDNKILIVNVTNSLDKNLTGLVATQLSRKFKRPTMLLRYNAKKCTFGGSIRGYEKGAIKDFKQLLHETNQFNFVEGHANAAGFDINADNIMKLNEILNNKLKDIQIDVDVHEVDFVISAKNLKESFVKELHGYKNLWGQKVDEPLLAIKEISVNKEDVQLMGKNKNTIKFTHKGIEYVKFFTNEDTYNNMISKGENLVIDVVGKASVNDYEGKQTGKIIIEDFEVVKVKKKEFIF